MGMKPIRVAPDTDYTSDLGLSPEQEDSGTPPSLQDLGASQPGLPSLPSQPMPKSILGDKVAPGEQITSKQMPRAEGAYHNTDPYHGMLKSYDDQASNIRGKMVALGDNATTDPDYFKKLGALSGAQGINQAAKAGFEKQHPWGSVDSETGVSNHPGVFGKIGHVLGEIGSVAAPSIAAEIPGSQINLSEKEAQGQAQEKTGAEMAGGAEKAQSAAEVAAARQEAARAQEEAATSKAEATDRQTTLKEQALNTQIADRTREVQAAGGDPTTDPQLQQLNAEHAALQKPSPEKTPPHITSQQKDGKSHIMERDPATGEYSIDRGVAPPNYGQSVLPTKTENLLGPDNVQHRYSWNPKTQRYDIDQGADPTGQAAHQIFQSAAIEQLVPQVVNDVQNHRDLLGNMGSYYKQWTLGTPIADPDAARLMGELMSLAATQPALHAFRSTNALQAFENIIGGLGKDPDATIQSINGLLLLPQTFTNMVHRPNAPPPPNHPTTGGNAPSFSDWKNNHKNPEVK